MWDDDDDKNDEKLLIFQKFEIRKVKINREKIIKNGWLGRKEEEQVERGKIYRFTIPIGSGVTMRIRRNVCVIKQNDVVFASISSSILSSTGRFDRRYTDILPEISSAALHLCTGK